MFLSLVLAACSSSSSPPTAAEEKRDQGAGTQEPTSDGSNIADASAPPAKLYQGSPLCKVSDGKCMPDDDGTKTPRAPEHACPLDADAGIVLACRITVAGGTPAPTCQAAQLDKVDGASCTVGTDCAPGFDCIHRGGNSGVCRRYCCAGTCKGQPAANGGATFCDVQRLNDANVVKVPVCMPLKACKLLTPGECSDAETCGVVTEQGDTGCVANGEAKVGESCEEDHCGVGLTCLGTAGTRSCYRLCKMDGSVPCDAMQECTTSTLFQDGNVGVCKDATAYAQ